MLNKKESLPSTPFRKISSPEIVQIFPIAMFAIDQEHTVTDWNESCEELTGISATDIIGTKNQWRAFYDHERPVLADAVLDGLSGEELEEFYEDVSSDLKNPSGAVAVDIFISDFDEGNGKWLMVTAWPLMDKEGNTIGSMEILQDITERVLAEQKLSTLINELKWEKLALLNTEAKLSVFAKKMEMKTIELQKAEKEMMALNTKLERLSVLDELTQLSNRRYFETRLIQEFNRMKRENTPLSIIMCDVDYFKKYNDTYGHVQGDSCLQKIASALSQSTRRPEDFIARYGGEEFAIVLPNVDAKGAAHVAELARKEIEQLKIKHSESEVSEYVTISLGITSQVPADSFSAEDLVNKADQALYKAKKNGRNRFAASEVE
jgi:diguanylate cyclase (GGDEF)-like protein/PAS domain S-box-containing protein